MPFYWSLRSVPELGHRSRKERRQAIWQVGLRPFRHLHVWAALVVTSFAILWGAEAVLGHLLLNPATANTTRGLVLLGLEAAAVVLLSMPLFRHFYLGALRGYLRHVWFDRTGSWWSAWTRSLLIRLVVTVLFLGCLGGLDWAINSFDEKPDPRISALLHWPEPIPDQSNGFFAAAGLQAAPGASPFEAGKAWAAAAGEAGQKHAADYPKPPEELKFVRYETKPRADAKSGALDAAARRGTYGQFCTAGAEQCWKVLQQERNDVQAWVAANQELLTRYLALQRYPQWQYASGTSLPAYTPMMHGQTLLHATALLAMDRKQTAKGLELIGADIRFARNMLGSKDVLIGKMVAATMLSRDLALLGETLAQRPGDLKPYWAQIEKMVEPLAPDQVSMADAFRFEQRWIISVVTQSGFAQSGMELPALGATWAEHHFKPNATANLLLVQWDHLLRRMQARGADSAPFGAQTLSPPQPHLSRWTGFMYNQLGKVFVATGTFDYREYADRLFDLNALNSLVRLQLALAEKGVRAKDVPAFLGNGDKSLWNPETGKPYAWDAERKQVYFAPATDHFSKRLSLGCGVPGRVGLTVM